MAKDAEAHASEDKAKRDEVEARNQLDSMVYQIEKMLKEHGDKISGSERAHPLCHPDDRLSNEPLGQRAREQCHGDACC